jgi:SAM-dependent methyltransferase
MQIFLLSEGKVVSTALSLAAELGIADLLAAGPRSSDELAQATSTHPQSLYRLLRLLSSVGVFSEVAARQFALTSLGECLRSEVPGSMRSWVRMSGLQAWLHTYAEALHSLRTGESVFKRATGAEFFDYFAAHPVEGEIFDGAMDDFGQMVSAAVVQAYDFGDITSIVDVGGGHGTLIAAILKHYPQMTGVLFELPHVAEGARQAISGAGLARRCEIVAGDFFQSVPAGCDAYILRWIVHDWDHDRALTILRNCRQAMKETGRLLLVEAVIPPGDDPHPGKLLDFLMLTGLGGQERTEAEYGELLREAGFRLNRIVPTDSHMSVVEAVPE